MIEATFNFAPGFLWGTATSSHQVEGANRNNDWWAWEEAGRIVEGHSAARACDWWEGRRWQEDFDRAASDHHNAHRLSVEWSRIEPTEGVWDEDALGHYREIVQGASERGLRPMVTLNHFTLPLWFAERGGWLQERAEELFARFARKVVSALADQVDLWITLNEPNVLAYQAYAQGLFPPGERDLGKALRVNHALIRAHAAAYQAIHQIQPHGQVGVAFHYRGMRPWPAWNPLARWVVRLRHETFNDAFPEALTAGRYRLLGRTYRLAAAKGTLDFFGLNYYTREWVAFDLRAARSGFGRGFFPEEAELSPTGFIANDPLGFWEALKWAHRYGLPIYITENGVEDSSDQLRPRYLAQHLRQVWRAANFNWQVKGYFHWTLVDNFEWERGWTQRFGLYQLDPESQKRTARHSARFYADICRRNGLASQAVAEYAPEVFDDLFPGKGPGELAWG